MTEWASRVQITLSIKCAKDVYEVFLPLRRSPLKQEWQGFHDNSVKVFILDRDAP